jgi:hypothetical protein
MRRFVILTCCTLLALALAGCSAVTGGKSPAASKQAKVLELVDAGKAKAALVLADELVAEAPADYQSYLTRNTVRLVLRDYPGALEDCRKALDTFEAARTRYPAKELAVREAKIREGWALTALVASRRAAEAAEKKSLDAVFAEQSAKVKELDEETFKNLRGMAGESVEQ